MNWKERRSELIQRLPTLMDILEDIALREETFHLDKSAFRGFFPTHYQEGMFTTMSMPDGQVQLWPVGLFPFKYYRGESQYHPSCKASLYRKGMTPAKEFLERLRYCELELLMEKHPMVDIFRNRTMFRMPDGTEQQIPLSIDTLAIAQHYGVCTELLDLTVSKWVAAFFACTKCKNDVYTPIKDTDSYGCFYEFEEPIGDILFKDPSSRRLHAVGLQPFSRPGEQAGYVIRMEKDQNFNRLHVRKIKFRHDPAVSELIFNYANRAQKLFPYELLQDKVKVIKENVVFSQAAYQMATERYFSKQPEEVIQQWKKEANIQIQTDPLVCFSPKECSDFEKEWPKRESEFYSRIYVRYAYNGPIQEVF